MGVTPKKVQRASGPARIVQVYELGWFTWVEIVSRLILAANDYPPERVVECLTPEMLAAVSEQSVTPPASPDDILILDYGGIRTDEAGVDWDVIRRADQRQYFDAVWRWHRYFAGSPDAGG